MKKKTIIEKQRNLIHNSSFEQDLFGDEGVIYCAHMEQYSQIRVVGTAVNVIFDRINSYFNREVGAEIVEPDLLIKVIKWHSKKCLKIYSYVINDFIVFDSDDVEFNDANGELVIRAIIFYHDYFSEYVADNYGGDTKVSSYHESAYADPYSLEFSGNEFGCNGTVESFKKYYGSEIPYTFIRDIYNQ